MSFLPPETNTQLVTKAPVQVRQGERTYNSASAETTPGAGIEFSACNNWRGERRSGFVLCSTLPQLDARLRIVCVDDPGGAFAVGDRP